MPYGTINADVVQSSVTGVSLGAGNATVFKNRIINGDMRIDQRNAGASVTPNAQYITDRWQFSNSQTGKFTAQQNAGSVTLPAGFINYLGFTSTSAYAITSSDYFILRQPIEGLNVADLDWGTANAKTVTLSFQVYSSLTGTFGGSLINSATTRSYPFTYSISVANTWTSISVTVAGDTSGTWLTTNGVGIYVSFGLGVGTTYSSTAGAWAAGNYLSATGAVSVVGTSGATFYITGVQLEVGSSATGFEYVDYTTQLSMCQRYYWKQTGFYGIPALGVGFANATTTARIYVKNPVDMRTGPTYGYSGTLYLLDAGGGGRTVTGLDTVWAGLSSSMIQFSASSGGLTGGNGTLLCADNSASYFITSSAEL